MEYRFEISGFRFWGREFRDLGVGNGVWSLEVGVSELGSGVGGSRYLGFGSDIGGLRALGFRNYL